MTETLEHPQHHELAVHEVLLLLDTDADTGLTSVQATERLQRYGPNLLPRLRRHNPAMQFLLKVSCRRIMVTAPRSSTPNP